KIKKPRITTKTITTSGLRYEALFGGAYAGTGQYERTAGGLYAGALDFQPQPTAVTPNVFVPTAVRQPTRQFTPTRVGERLAIIPRERQISQEKLMIKPQERTRIALRDRLSLIQRERLRQRLITTPSYALRQQVPQRTALRYRYRQRFRPRQESPPIRPRIIVPPPPIPLTQMEKLYTKKAKPTGFITEVRRRGQFFELDLKPTTRGRALRKGVGFVKRTLGATFRIKEVPVGRKLGRDISFRVDPKIFRVKGPTFIQKTAQEGGLLTGRLTSPTETKEI
ncbi:unnamed protein product, partial [marine sediment metagenome]